MPETGKLKTEAIQGEPPVPLSGEAIRTMNYVDDISVTLRRILSVLPILNDEEKARVAEHIKHADPSYDSVVAAFSGK
jgi:paraquat-inducible protein B